FRLETRRCATRRRFWARRYQAGCSTCSPSLVVISDVSPTSMPTSTPVPGEGSGATAHASTAYHLPALRVRRSVLIVPGTSRCQRTATRPIPAILSLRPSTLNPLPYSLNPKLLNRCFPLKRG